MTEAALAVAPGTIATFPALHSMAGNKYRLWTPEDDRRLLDLHAAGRSAISISAALKRSREAVQGRLSILRALAKSPQPPERATEDNS